VLFPIKKILNIDKYVVCESRDMSDESGTYIILLKYNFIAFILERLSLINNNRYTYSMNGIINS
jgi:hypothetical protein